MKWNNIIKGDYETYPREGIDVLVSDGINYDIVYYIMSGEYKWLKVDLIEDDCKDFVSFDIIKWIYCSY